MNKDLNLLLVLALTVLVAAIPNKVELPEKFYQLVQDKTNVMLLLGLCFLISYCNFPLGVMMSLFVFMVMAYSQHHLEGFESNSTEEIDDLATLPDEANDNGIDMIKGSDDTESDLPPLGNKSANNSMMKNDVNGPPQYVKDMGIPPQYMSKSTTQAESTFESGSTASDLEALANEISQKKMKAKEVCDRLSKIITCPSKEESKEDPKEEFNSAYSNDTALDESNDVEEGFIGRQIREQFQSQKATGHDYDVVGCRYDLQGNLNNEFVQGPPLAGCNTYDSSASNQIGSDFYPINP